MKVIRKGIHMGLEPCVTKLPELGEHEGVRDSTLHFFLCVQNISWYISFRELINNQGIISITLMQVSALLYKLHFFLFHLGVEMLTLVILHLCCK